MPDDSITTSPPPTAEVDYGQHHVPQAQRRDTSIPSPKQRKDGGARDSTAPGQAGLRPPLPRQTWHRRPRSPGLKWHKEYTPETRKQGRVLMIDYVRKDQTREGMRKVTAEEFDDLDGLRRVYDNPSRNREACLRVFHVQNAFWATRFLLHKFNIDNRDDLVGTTFGRWARYQRPERRAGKPMLNGKTWKTQHDPWRGISRTAFSVDYLKHYPSKDPSARQPEDEDLKMTELNCYDVEDNPTYGYDVYVQRLSCYIQHKETVQVVPDDPDIENPYIDSKGRRKRGVNGHEYVPKLETLDNGNTIIIFETSQSGSIDDTMIGARQDMESRWRRLPFYLALESKDVSNDENMALECMKMILQDLFKSISGTWEKFIDVCYNHVSVLEDKIYEQPADESRAPELWTNSSVWLKVEKLMLLHVDVMKDMTNYLGELTENDESESSWLAGSPGDFDRLGNLVQEDLIKPTANLADLMYKSVGIRDSRHSLTLGTSMWRLSWITFIFLPLTFMVGFFGMNVDTFQNNPSIKWYFIVAVPLMLLILMLWYFLKHLLARSRQTPYQRGIYEHLFHDLATDHPTLWSRTGPRDYVIPADLISRLKWRLIKSWSVPSKTIRARPDDLDDGNDLGTWSRIKRHLTKKWTAQMHVQNTADPSASMLELGDSEADGDVATGVAGATELFMLPGVSGMNGGAEQAIDNSVKILLHTPSMPLDSHSAPQERPGSAGARRSSRDSHGSPGRNSGVMVEEEEPNWLTRVLHSPPHSPKERSKSPNRPRSKGSSGDRDSKVMSDEAHVDEGRRRESSPAGGGRPRSVQEGLRILMGGDEVGTMGSASGFGGGL
ncbi:MAG: hypothetical protein M1836_000037 [Candelina mexicana]|nr:MAG: hypothetical protein M1836_000037 [Candelina mexicana]